MKTPSKIVNKADNCASFRYKIVRRYTLKTVENCVKTRREKPNVFYRICVTNVFDNGEPLGFSECSCSKSIETEIVRRNRHNGPHEGPG